MTHLQVVFRCIYIATVNSPPRDDVPPPPLLDRLGVVASTACAVHCVATALLPAALAALGLSALGGHEAEWVFTSLAVLVATSALVMGWRRRASPAAALALGAGIVGLISSRFLEESGGHGVGIAVGLASGALLVLGHVLNLRAPSKCPPSPAADPCCTPE